MSVGVWVSACVGAGHRDCTTKRDGLTAHSDHVVIYYDRRCTVYMSGQK